MDEVNEFFKTYQPLFSSMFVIVPVLVIIDSVMRAGLQFDLLASLGGAIVFCVGIYDFIAHYKYEK